MQDRVVFQFSPNLLNITKSIVRCICACGLCARANNFRVRRYLSEYIETEMAEVTNPGNAKEETQVQSRNAMTFLSDHSS